MLLTFAEARALFETDLVDEALQILLDAAEEEIVTHAGPHATASGFFTRPLSRSVFLDRKAASITSVRERIGNDETVLDATDYRLNGVNELVRLDNGVNPRSSWGDEVNVAYVPVSDATTRKRVQIDLVRLAAQYNAASSERSGDYDRQSPAYQEERGKLLGQLTGGWVVR